MRIVIRSAALAFCSVMICPVPGNAVSCSSSPLVLDLGGDGIRTTGLSNPVVFDLNGNGSLVKTGWTVEGEEDPFLWIDLNIDGRVNGARELFGDATLLPDGSQADNGFDALKTYDGKDYGGNADGLISELDLAWPSLRLWTDRNHDGTSQLNEISELNWSGVEEIELSFREDRDIDGFGNWHFLKSSFSRRIEAPWGETIVRREIEDLYFLYSQSTP